MRTTNACVSGLMMIGVFTPAAIAQETPPTDADDIVVMGLGGKEFKLSPDKLRGAVKAFENHRAAFAPAASLRWQILPKENASQVAIFLRGDVENDRIPVDAEGLFSLPADKVLSGHYRLAARAGKTPFRIVPLAFSPGSTRTDYRFGDARLICQVYWGFIAPDTFIAARGLFNMMGGCSAKSFGIYYSTEKPIAAVSIDHWPQKIDIAKDGKAWRVPLYDKSISNDARVHITYRTP